MAAVVVVGIAAGVNSSALVGKMGMLRENTQTSMQGSVLGNMNSSGVGALVPPDCSRRDHGSVIVALEAMKAIAVMPAAADSNCMTAG